MAAKLTPKQQRFIDEYSVDLNATAAAGRAGYSDPNYGRQLLTIPNVAKVIAAAQAKRSARVEVTQDYVLSNLVEIVERSMQRAPVTSKGEQVQEDGKGVWAFDGKVAVAALALLGKHLSMFVERVQVEGGISVIEDENWYSNRAHESARAAQSSAPPAANPPAPRAK